MKIAIQIVFNGEIDIDAVTREEAVKILGRMADSSVLEHAAKVAASDDWYNLEVEQFST